jgi:hypothetical protein
MDEYYPKIGFNNLGLGTSLLKAIKLLGLLVSLDNPKTEKLKLRIGHLKNLKGKELLHLLVKNLLIFQERLTRQ